VSGFQNRYYGETLKGDLGEHYSPVVEVDMHGRDVFGNRYYPSYDNRVYFDRLFELREAGLLVSPEGQEIVHRCPRILSSVSEMLELSQDSLKQGEERQTSDGATFSLLGSKGQSDVYLYKPPGVRDLVVKKRLLARNDLDRADQPYLHEMLQVQGISRYLSEFPVSRRTKISFADYLFATSDVLCQPFYKGRAPSEAALINAGIRELELQINAYLDYEEASHNPLFRGVYSDLSIYKTSYLRTDNFIKTEAGDIICIDPFVLFTKEQFERGSS
jgi:hypothetical protein